MLNKDKRIQQLQLHLTLDRERKRQVSTHTNKAEEEEEVIRKTIKTSAKLEVRLYMVVQLKITEAGIRLVLLYNFEKSDPPSRRPTFSIFEYLWYVIH